MQYIPSLSIIPHGSWRKKFEIFSTWLPFVCHTDWNELWQHYFRWKQCAAMQKRRRAALGFLSSYSNSWFVVTEPEEQIRFCIFFKQVSGTEWYIMFIPLQFSSFVLPSKDPKMALVCVWADVTCHLSRVYPCPVIGCWDRLGREKSKSHVISWLKSKQLLRIRWIYMKNRLRNIKYMSSEVWGGNCFIAIMPFSHGEPLLLVLRAATCCPMFTHRGVCVRCTFLLYIKYAPRCMYRIVFCLGVCAQTLSSPLTVTTGL